MRKRFRWDDSESYKIQRARRAPNIFGSKESSNLQVSRVLKKSIDGEDTVLSVLPTTTIQDVTHLRRIKASTDLCQVFYIRQNRSWALLNIDQDTFEELLVAYDVFLRFWDFAFAFGLKHRESDIGNVPFRMRSTKPNGDRKGGSFECAYGLRYVELNGRKETSDHEPWSVRQTAVYQRFDFSERERCTFIIIAPAKIAEQRVEEVLQDSEEEPQAISPFNLHRILIADSIKNWRWYISSLEDRMTDQSNRVILAKVGTETEKLSPLTDFNINFVDRQRLKILEDRVLDLQIIFDSSANTIDHVRRSCTQYCRMYCQQDLTECNCAEIGEELDELLAEVNTNQKKALVLHKRTQATAQLLSDLLDYENAQIAHGNEVALKQLAQESSEENRAMRGLTEKSTRDAAAVKILTVITLIYLPATVVTNFYSSQLVVFDKDGNLSAAHNAWVFAATSIPLTVVTLFAWWAWMTYTRKKEQRAVERKRRRMEAERGKTASESARKYDDRGVPLEKVTIDIA